MLDKEVQVEEERSSISKLSASLWVWFESVCGYNGQEGSACSTNCKFQRGAKLSGDSGFESRAELWQCSVGPTVRRLTTEICGTILLALRSHIARMRGEARRKLTHENNPNTIHTEAYTFNTREFRRVTLMEG